MWFLMVPFWLLFDTITCLRWKVPGHLQLLQTEGHGARYAIGGLHFALHGGRYLCLRHSVWRLRICFVFLRKGSNTGA